MTLLQFGENLSDRRTADADRSRTGREDLLGLSLSDSGFDASVPSEFRSRLVKGGAESLLFDRSLAPCREQGFLARHGSQRTDSTCVLGAARTLARLACAIGTLRHALDALAVAAPDRLRAHADSTWTERHERRGGDVHVPKGEVARRAFAETVGRDGEALPSAVTGPGAPPWLREVPAIEDLRRVRVQNVCRLDDDVGPSTPEPPRVLSWRTEGKNDPPSTPLILAGPGCTSMPAPTAARPASRPGSRSTTRGPLTGPSEAGRPCGSGATPWRRQTAASLAAEEGWLTSGRSPISRPAPMVLPRGVHFSGPTAQPKWSDNIAFGCSTRRTCARRRISVDLSTAACPTALT